MQGVEVFFCLITLDDLSWTQDLNLGYVESLVYLLSVQYHRWSIYCLSNVIVGLSIVCPTSSLSYSVRTIYLGLSIVYRWSIYAM